jgi:hypothetical protein
MENPTENDRKPDSRAGCAVADLFGGLVFAGCKNHPHRTDLSCCKIRNADGTPLSVADTWAEIQRLRSGIDCAANALTDSILCSGNDAATNMHFVRKMKALLSPL